MEEILKHFDIQGNVLEVKPLGKTPPIGVISKYIDSYSTTVKVMFKSNISIFSACPVVCGITRMLTETILIKFSCIV